MVQSLTHIVLVSYIQ